MAMRWRIRINSVLITVRIAKAGISCATPEQCRYLECRHLAPGGARAFPPPIAQSISNLNALTA